MWNLLKKVVELLLRVLDQFYERLADDMEVRRSTEIVVLGCCVDFCRLF
jgi:hypothetical protein